jgi:hypothetical protein
MNDLVTLVARRTATIRIDAAFQLSDCAKFLRMQAIRHGTMLPSLSQNKIGTSEFAIRLQKGLLFLRRQTPRA